MKFVFNGGEVVVVKIVRKFVKILSKWKLLIMVMYLVWGMLEIVFGVVYFY